MTSSAIRIVKPDAASPPVQAATVPKPPIKEEKKLCRNILIYGECRFESKGCCYAHSTSTLSTTAHDFVPTPTATPAPPLDAPINPIAEEYYPPQEQQYYDEEPQPQYYPQEQREPIQYHHYHPASSLAKPTTSYFLPPSLHTALTQKSEAHHSTTPQEFVSKLPAALGDYTALVLLDHTNSRESEGAPSEGWARYRTWVYKAWNKTTGKTYALRRIEGFRLQHESAISSIEKWARLSHPSLVSVREAFTTRAFGDQSLIFVHDYYPLSTTLYEAHLSPASTLPPNPWSLPSSSIHSSQSYQHQQQQQIQMQQQQQMNYNGYSMQPQSQDPRYRNTSQSRNPQPPNLSSLNLGNNGNNSGIPNPGLAEGLIWSYIIQLTMALRTIHNAGLAMRNLDASKILITSRTPRSSPSFSSGTATTTTNGNGTTSNERIRIRIGSCGTADVLLSTSQSSQFTIPPHLLAQYQQEDLTSLSAILLQLTNASPHAMHNIPKSLDHLSRHYSPELKNVVVLLLNGGVVESGRDGGRGGGRGGMERGALRKGVEDVLGMCGAVRVAEELSEGLASEDVLESHLMRELENGRLVRLLTKFGFINERPEFDHDPRWAETGDRYIIKLFRDYVFHQVDENGRPVTDLSHVLSNLNKLDAGTEEKIMLISRDEQSCLIVSFKEIKNCIESAFVDLSR